MLWPLWRYNPGIHLEWLRKIMKPLRIATNLAEILTGHLTNRLQAPVPVTVITCLGLAQLVRLQTTLSLFDTVCLAKPRADNHQASTTAAARICNHTASYTQLHPHITNRNRTLNSHNIAISYQKYTDTSIRIHWNNKQQTDLTSTVWKASLRAQVKLSLCLPKHHAPKTYWRSGG
jgi:hypothetical protein